MISEQDFAKAVDAGREFVPAITSCKYHPKHDQVELVTPWGTIIVNRLDIEELRGVTQHNMRSIQASSIGIHIEEKDIDINSAGLIICIAKRLETEAAKSL